MSGHGGGRGRGRGEDHDEEHGGDERWLLSYADFITLLLALFMVLFALSTVDRNKFAEFRSGLVSAFDSAHNASPTVPGGTGLLDESSLVKAAGASKQLTEQKPTPADANPGSGSATLASATTSSESAETAKAAAKIRAKLAAKGLGGDVHIEQTARGLVIQLLTDKVFFSSGSAGMAAAGTVIVDTIGDALNELPNAISIEGNTDNQPIHSAQYPTNWELSTARAVVVLRRLAEHDHVNPAQLEATGYADERPIVPNDTPADRARNRRVEIVVLTDVPTSESAPATTAPTTGNAATSTVTPPVASSSSTTTTASSPTGGT